jgi:hypothetical protein
MDIIGRFTRELTLEFVTVIDWALRNWAITAAILMALIYRTGKQRRLNRHSH